jgi:hypothetical protein
MGQRPVSKCKAHWVNPERNQQNTYMKHQQEKIAEATTCFKSLRSIFCRHRVTLLFSPVLSCADKLRGCTHRRTLLRSFRSPMLTQPPQSLPPAGRHTRQARHETRRRFPKGWRGFRARGTSRRGHWWPSHMTPGTPGTFTDHRSSRISHCALRRTLLSCCLAISRSSAGPTATPKVAAAINTRKSSSRFIVLSVASTPSKIPCGGGASRLPV